MENKNREFKSIDVQMGGEIRREIQDSRNSAKKDFHKDQMHMPCSNMNYFGCKSRGDY